MARCSPRALAGRYTLEMRWLYGPRASWLILGSLAVLLGILATLQYHWLGEVSQAERERLRSGLAAAVGRFAQDFDREVTRAYFHFFPVAFSERRAPAGAVSELHVAAPDPSRTEALANQLFEQLASWREVAPYPELVRDVLWLEKVDEEDWHLARLDPETGRLDAVAETAALRELRRRLQDSMSYEGGARHSGPPPGPLFLAPEVPAAVIPRVEFSEGRGNRRRRGRFSRPSLSGVVLIRFDVDFLREGLFPELGSRHLAWSQGLEYDFAVFSREAFSREASGSPSALYRSDPSLSDEVLLEGDRQIELFRLLPWQESRELWHEMRRQQAGASQGSASRDRGFEEPERWAFERALRWFRPPFDPRDAQGHDPSAPDGRAPDGRLPGSAQEPAGVESWLLAVRHPEGSLEAAVEQARHRNLAVSSGVLLLLSVTVAMLLISMRRARELASRQVEFVAGITHELRTPLAAIRSLAQNLADGIVEKPEQARRYGAMIEKEGDRLSAMVEQVLELSGILSERAAYSFEEIDVPEIVAEAMDECRPLLTEAFRFEQKTEATLPPVSADPAALRRAVRNLIANAMKYGGDGWVGIDLFVTRPGGHPGGSEVGIRISDHGPGIPRDEIPRLFEAFYRGRGATEAQIPGSGLGLSLVKHVVDAHGGRIEVESGKPRGSKFTIYLPTAERAVVMEGTDGELPDPVD